MPLRGADSFLEIPLPPIRTLLTLSLATLSACGVPVVGDLDPQGRDVGSLAQDTDVRPMGEYASCDHTHGDADCPASSFCHAQADRCVECLLDETRCDESGVLERCEEPQLHQGVLETGGRFEPAPCPNGFACVAASPSEAGCVEKICSPTESVCLDALTSHRCNATGTDWETQTCFAGKACYEGLCEKLRHNVLLIFDTSGSMFQYIDSAAYPNQCETLDLPCLAPWPLCDDGDAPLTAMTLAKKVFGEELQQAVEGHVQFALQRFPQREALGQTPHCAYGLYTPQALLSQDDGSWDTGTAGWFEAHLKEALVVPFPKRLDGDNRASLLKWMNHEEQVGATEIPCDIDAECPTGLCGTVGGERRCFYHQDPELRAGGETPLGKSLFYAGEYFRRFVAVEGRPCTSAKSCGSAGYLCVNATCQDPYAACRENHIILFTDGAQNPARPSDDFFHPVNQAKRLAFGLACQENTDCRGGATCNLGVCVPPELSYTDVVHFGAGGGFDALSTPGGGPLSIRVSVVNLQTHSKPDNQGIAEAGGGALLDVSTQEPEDFRVQVRTLLKYKLKCEPKDLVE